MKHLRFILMLSLTVLALSPLTASANPYYGEGPLGAMTSKYQKLSHKNGFFASLKTLDYYLLKPRAQEPDTLYPLVIALHGTPGKAYAGFYLAQPKMRNIYPAYVVAPVTPSTYLWDYPRKHKSKKMALPYVVSLIKDLKKDYPIDPDRIYIIGCSSGGIGAFAAMAKYPDIFAAGVAISGFWTIKDGKKLTDAKLQILHGAHDTTVPVEKSRNMAKAINEAGGAANYTELKDFGHSCPNKAFYSQRMWNWLFWQKKE